MHIPQEEMLPNKIKFWGGSLDEILETNNLSINDHYDLLKYCRKIGIEYLCTPFSPKAVDILNEMEVKAFKTGSGEMMNYSIINKILKTKKPLMMSCGMSTVKEIEEIVEYLILNKSKFIILNCTSIYPCPYYKVNLGFIEVLKKKYNILVGHSDHTPDYWTAIGAASKGAVLVEKHFTLSRELKGPDYQVSLEPIEFRTMVNAIKIIHKASKSKKSLLKEEKIVQRWARHSVVTKMPLNLGEKLKIKNLTVKRPGTGIPAKYLNELSNYKTLKKIKKNDIINWSDIKLFK
jgi:sialic acid synthase SpsE